MSGVRLWQERKGETRTKGRKSGERGLIVKVRFWTQNDFNAFDN